MSAKRVIGITASAYEFVALTTNRVPPFTEIARRHPTLAAVFVSYMVWHFSPDWTDSI